MKKRRVRGSRWQGLTIVRFQPAARMKTVITFGLWKAWRMNHLVALPVLQGRLVGRHEEEDIQLLEAMIQRLMGTKPTS